MVSCAAALLPRPGTATLQRWGGAARSGGACLLWEPRHLPSGEPEGGSEHPLHQLAWSQALPGVGGGLQSETLSFLGRMSVARSLHCLCGVWLVKQPPLCA